MTPSSAVINKLRNDRLDLINEPAADGEWGTLVKSYLGQFEMETGQHVMDLDDCQWWLDEWDGLHS